MDCAEQRGGKHLTQKTACRPESRTRSHLWLLLILIVLVYSNTFNAAWHLDDFTNILDNTNVHVSKLSMDSLVQERTRTLHGSGQP